MENIIIGSGPAGRLAAVELGKLGKEVLLIEKNHIAGTCLNEGCMVINALNDVAKFIANNKRFNDYGFIKSDVNLDYSILKDKVIETQEKLRKINEIENKSLNNTLIYGEASLSDEEVIVNGESYEYENLLVATGARPLIPNVKGSEYGITNKDILKLEEVPEKLNIIGGGVLGAEVANIFSKFGSEVNIFVRSVFLKFLDDKIKDYLLNKILADVKVHENSELIEVKKNKTITSTGEFDGLTYFSTGRIPNSEIVKGIVDLNNDNTIKVDKQMKTSKENIYAAGDVTGGYGLTPIARMEGTVAARNMAGFSSGVSYDCVPQSISLDLDVSYFNNNLIEQGKTKTIETPGVAGPDAFWRILTKDTGYTKIEMNEEKNQIQNLISMSPSSISDVAYLSYLTRINVDLEEFDQFIELHPSTDANYGLIKKVWL